MRNVLKKLRRVLKDEQGATTIEYGLVVIAVVLFTAAAINSVARHYDEPLAEAAQDIEKSREELSYKP